MKQKAFTLIELLVVIFIFFQCISTNATEINLDQKIPLDKEITYGKLDNGFTYYIKKNTSPKKKATIHLIVKAGSLMEDDDQLGLAHLIEHMVFNGTKNFPKDSIDKYFNSIGLSIGADFNASTGHEKTVYKFNIPTEKKENIEKGIHILSEISNFAILDDESFAKERKIVEAEWRRDQGRKKRLYEELKEYFYINSKYAKRIVIGDINIIRNFPNDTARRFYNDWYRPDLMAVIAIGDFDPKYVEGLVKKFFNKVKAKNKRSLPDTTIPKYQKTLYVSQKDPEQTKTVINILNKNLKLKSDSARNFREVTIRRFCTQIFQKRLNSILLDKKSSLLSGYIGIFNLTLNNEFYYIGAQLKEDEIKEGINILFTEIERVKQNGFTPIELEIEKERLIQFYEQAIKAKKTRNTGSIVAEYTRNFLENEFVLGEEREYELMKQLMPTISVSDLNNHFLNWLRLDDRIINIKYPEKIANIISKDELLNLETKIQKNKLSQFVSLVRDEPLLDKKLPGSKIIFTKKYPSINTREFRLENGVRVFLKPTKNKEKSFYFEATSMGGYSHANLTELPSAKITDDLISESGLGDFSRVELDNKIVSSFADVGVQIGPYQESLKGGAITKYTKELFELIYLNFTSVSFNDVGLENVKSYLREKIRNENLDPSKVFFKRIRHILYKNHPRRRPWNLNLIDQIKLDKINDFYMDRFADSSDFVFTFVGDFSIDEMKPYIEKYLGSLPSIKRKENYIDHNIRIENKFKKIEVTENSEEKSVNYRFYSHKFKNNIKNRTKLYILENVLKRILREEIRERKNLVYSINAGILQRVQFPTQSYTFYIFFDSDPKDNDLIFSEIDRILEKLKNGDFEENYIDEAKLNQINQINESIQKNSFLAYAINTYFFENESITTFNNLAKTVQSITNYEIEKISKKTFTDNFIQATLLPK